MPTRKVRSSLIYKKKKKGDARVGGLQKKSKAFYKTLNNYFVPSLLLIFFLSHRNLYSKSFVKIFHQCAISIRLVQGEALD